MIAVAYTVTVLILLGCIARGAPALRPGRVILRARWAWACRKPPARSEGEELDHDEKLALGAADRAWRQPAAPEPERTRT